MSEKKVVGRGIAIVLGISCVVLVVGLVFVVSGVYRLSNIVDLCESQILLDQHYFIFESNGEADNSYSVGYAGYVTVQLESASPSIYIEVSYYANGLSYSRRVNPGVDEANVTFPILPASVEIAVGNLNASRASAIITATYFY
ncbi:MAG: hypothetical protein ABSG57_12560 [Candidatus Bathyarchaeia archaeon]